MTGTARVPIRDRKPRSTAMRQVGDGEGRKEMKSSCDEAGSMTRRRRPEKCTDRIWRCKEEIRLADWRVLGVLTPDGAGAGALRAAGGRGCAGAGFEVALMASIVSADCPA